MKLKTTLLLILLIGIAVAEWGCNDDEEYRGGGRYLFKITDISSIDFYDYENRSILNADTIQWDSFTIQLSYQSIQVVLNDYKASSTALIATPPVMPETDWRIDSFYIYDYLVDSTIDIKQRFLNSNLDGYMNYLNTTVENMNNTLSRYYYDPYSFGHSFKYSAAPTLPNWHRYKFEIFGSDSTHFTAVSDSLYITIE